MRNDLLIDFELAIENIAQVYFFIGFISGFLVCAFIVAFALYFTR